MFNADTWLFVQVLLHQWPVQVALVVLVVAVVLGFVFWFSRQELDEDAPGLDPEEDAPNFSRDAQEMVRLFKTGAVRSFECGRSDFLFGLPIYHAAIEGEGWRYYDGPWQFLPFCYSCGVRSVAFDALLLRYNSADKLAVLCYGAASLLEFDSSAVVSTISLGNPELIITEVHHRNEMTPLSQEIVLAHVRRSA